MKFIVFLFALSFSIASFAHLPPRYLNVPHYKHCVSTVTRGTAQYICLPQGKPAGCPLASWNRLNSQHLVGRCLLGQNKTPDSFSSFSKGLFSLLGIA